MSLKVCISATTLGYPEGGGHAWVFLNWALGLRAAGAEVIWLEAASATGPSDKLLARAAVVRERLAQFGLGDGLVLLLDNDGRDESLEGYRGLEHVEDADLLIDFHYWLKPSVVKRFRRSALVDLDPGITQTCVNRGEMRLTPHDTYFTIGEMIGRAGSDIPDLGLRWHYTPPAVSLDAWPSVSDEAADRSAAFTAVSHWHSNEYMPNDDGSWYLNDKRSGYAPYFDLPLKTDQAMELAIFIEDDDPDVAELRRRGWRVRRSAEVSGNTTDYRRYIQRSRGEFGCSKPAYVKLKTRWLSDRTLCYLASGRPAVVQNTGSSAILPDRCGLLRFNTVDEAATCVNAVNADYAHHSRAARALAEEFFDAKKVAARLLETALN